MSQKKDRIGHYFTCFREETGMSTDIDYLSYYRDGSFEIDRIDHAISDAHGAFFRISESRGESPLELPKVKSEAAPSLWSQAIFLKKYLKVMGRTLEPTLKRSTAAIEGTTFAHHSYEVDDSNHIQTWCKTRGVSQTAFLTWTLHKAIAVQSGAGEHSCRWSIPVSMKGPLQFGDKANHAVPLFLSLDSSVTVQGVHALVRDQLSSGMHWGAYRMIYLLSFLPKILYRILIRSDEINMAKKGQWFAIFSNGGILKGDDRVMYKTAKAQTNSTAPIKASGLSWNGRLTLGINVHNSMLPHTLDGNSLMECWKEIIRSTKHRV